MTTENIVLTAIVSGTCWTAIIHMSINHAAKRIIERLDALGKKLEKN
jgi:hypothetical protein